MGFPKTRCTALAVMVGLFATLGAGVAGAVSLTTTPVIIHFKPGQRVASMTVSNHGQKPITFQIRPFIWTQDHNQNVLKPTGAVLISPPIATLAPGAQQVVRFGLNRLPKERESSYRLLLEEIPPPAGPGEVQIVLRFSMPIFAEPRMPVAAHVRWRIINRNGHAFLEGTNDGKRHLVVDDIVLTNATSQALKVEGTGGAAYILAGATRRWPIETSAPLTPGSFLRMSAQHGARRIDKRVKVAKEP